MAKIRINKIDSARRQLDAAIRLTFSGEDPVAIHTIANAAHQIIRDVCGARGDIASYRRVQGLIRPGHEKEFWTAVNRSGSFFKHANKDPEGVHEMDEGQTDFAIMFAATWYCDLGFSPSPEMVAFIARFAERHPHLRRPDLASGARE